MTEDRRFRFYCPECNMPLSVDKLPYPEASAALVCSECGWYEWSDDLTEVSAREEPVKSLMPWDDIAQARRHPLAWWYGFVCGMVGLGLTIIAVLGIGWYL